MLQPRTGGFACSGRAKVDRLRALAHAVRLDVEGDLLAVDERAQARGLYRGDVDEHVLGAAVRRDEAEAFGGVEELYGAGLGHWGNSFTRQSCGLPAASPLRQVPVVSSAIMHWRMVKPPAENGAVRDSHLSGKGRPKRAALRVVNARTRNLLHGNVMVARQRRRRP